MPRNVRNVWIKVECNEAGGRVVETGPKTKEGGADATIFVRREGDVYAAGYITARRLEDRIVVTWRPESGPDVELYAGARDAKPAARPPMPTRGACSCRPGIARDNCPQCEGTGRAIDWARYHGEGRCTCPAHQVPASARS